MVSASVADVVLQKIPTKILSRYCHIHMLWGRHFLKDYCTRANNCIIWNVDRRTHSKLNWTFIRCVSSNDMVSSVRFI